MLSSSSQLDRNLTQAGAIYQMSIRMTYSDLNLEQSNKQLITLFCLYYTLEEINK
jgi:hypothetical protein